MASPAPAKPPPPGPGNPTFEAVLAALAAYYASREAIHATTLPPRLLTLLTEVGVPRAVGAVAGQLAASLPMPGRHRVGVLPATPGSPLPRRVAAREAELRARYVLAAARRLVEASAQGRWGAGLAAERRYVAAHVLAGRARRAAARQLEDTAGDTPGLLLRWVTHLDDNTCDVCRRLDGSIFTRDRLPEGQMPGAVHLHCRCAATPAGGGELVKVADRYQLRDYWLHGEGASRWKTWTDLYNHLKRKVSNNRAKRMAAAWYHMRYGRWPGEKRD